MGCSPFQPPTTQLERMVMASENGERWYARLTALLILAIVGWCVVVVANGSRNVQANTTANAVQDEALSTIKSDLSEIKGDIKTLLGRR